jgi:uncharacterized protein YdhG (YjbR/CyaY superfamily)
MEKADNIDQYISGFPDKVQEKLKQLRETIKTAAPDAVEVISYQMPAFKMNGVLVYFAGYKNHVGFYPTASGIRAFQNRLSDFKWSKGAIQFPLDKPLPIDLINEIVQFRVNETSKKLKK